MDWSRFAEQGESSHREHVSVWKCCQRWQDIRAKSRVQCVTSCIKMVRYAAVFGVFMYSSILYRVD